MPKGRPPIPPKLTLKDLHETVMERIAGWSVPVGVFIVAGRLRCMRSTAPTFDRYAASLWKGGFVGTYDLGADSRVVMGDLACLYKDGAALVDNA